MKKIININLSGRVIPIEDSAYEGLQRYIESLRRYFANEEGRDEIINDIESRIAELMNDKIKKGASAITDADVEEIINAMGRVEDFEKTETTEAAGDYQQAAGSFDSGQKERFKGRLYRNTSDKILGGVCSGIANYVNVDPVVVRLLFAIITFGGFGLGFLLYVLLWIILPSRGLDTYVGKRFFRNPDDQIIGGVCGGLAAYFNKSSQTIRLIFAAPLIINIFFSVLNGIFSLWVFDHSPVEIAFGSITSTFILAYIVLWIVLPLARTQYEKMEMRGEKVDVNRIRQNVQEGMNDFKNRAQAWGEEVKDSAKQFGKKAKDFADTRGKSFATEAAQSARPIVSGIGHAIGVLFKAFFLFVVGSIAFALFVGLMVVIFGGGTVLWPLKQAIFEFVLDGFWQKTFFWGTVIFFLIVPLVAFLTWLIRRIMRVRSQKSHLAWIFGGLWTVGWVSFVLLMSSLSRDFRTEEDIEQTVNVNQPQNGKMILTVSSPEISYSRDIFFIDVDNNGWDFTDDSLRLANIRLEFDASKDSNYYVTVFKHSRGRSRSQANELARKIGYEVVSKDSILDLGSGYGISRADKFRGQDVWVEVKVPVGKKIRFDESVADKLSPFYLRMRGNRRDRFDWDDKYVFGYRAEEDYTMTAKGRLVSDKDEANKLKAEKEERQQDSIRQIAPPQPDSIDRIIEQREKELEELRRKKNSGSTGKIPNRKKAGSETAFQAFPMMPLII
ncbi:MAG TPA: PspC domain-containing protein [Flavisolibacter sp.]|nr:PspC domain-containing protein [Flavisolibacter sp.]